MNDAERAKILSTAREVVLAALPETRALYVYGSFARGEERSDSDLDLAVLLPDGRRIPNAWELGSEIALRVKRDVDVVDLGRASDVLRHSVLSEGRALFAPSPDELLAWEASAMSRYARHREEIRDLLADFHRTGVGYSP
jgi:predicted nucleotidyltransferase